MLSFTAGNRARVRIAACLVGMALSIATAISASGKEPRPRRAEVVELFANTAFTRSPKIEWNHTRRWPDAVRIAIDGAYATEDASKVAHTRDLIRRVIQRPMPIFFTPLSAEEMARTQVVVAFGERAGLEAKGAAVFEAFRHSAEKSSPVTATADCRISISSSSEHRLTFAVVLVATELTEADRAHCITKKLTQAMGFPGEASGSRPSVFDTTGRVKHTLHDRALLWLLYHPEMSVGLDRDKARQRVDELLRREGMEWLNSQNEGMASSSPPRGRLLAMAGRRVR